MRVLGVPLPGPLSVVGAALGTARGVVSLVGAPRRPTLTGPGRLYIDVHGIHGEGGAGVARRIERALESHPHVDWARVNGPSSRVCVAVAHPRPRTAEIAALARRAGRTPASLDDEAVEDEAQHPADGLRGTRLVPTLLVDAVGLGMSLLARIAPWTPLPPEVAALLGVPGHHPDLAERLAHRAHSHTRADSMTSMVGAVAQGLAQGNEGIVLDVAQRVGQWREARALERAWWEVEGRVVTGPDAVAAAVPRGERPAALADGAVERYQRAALRAGAVAASAALPVAGPRKALALGLSAVPKAADTARSAFGSALGRVLGLRGAVVMDRAALRRVDRVDAVVLDRAALRTGRLALSDLLALPDADPHEVAERAWGLFDPATGAAGPRHGEGDSAGWWLAPLEGSRGQAERDRLLRRGATSVLGLGRADRLHAVVGLREETLPGAHLLTVAAQHSRLPVHETDDAAGTVRALQARGHGVLLVSGDSAACAAADLGAGVYADDHPPWGAHVLVGTDLPTAALLVESVGAMKALNAQSIRLSQTATGVGVVAALHGGRGNPTSRVMHAVNAGSAVALVAARRHAARLREPRAVELVDTVPWHAMPLTAVLRRLDCGAGGLSESEAARRKSERGVAALAGTSLGSAFLAELANPLTPVLAGGAALSAAVGSPVDAALVAAVVGVSALVGSVQQLRTERRLADLLSRSAVSATVVRDGDARVVTSDDLVPGDVVALTAGDVIPADCRVVDAAGCEVDESSLTGESLPVPKSSAAVVASVVAERSSMVYEGTTVAAGEATAVVVAVGDDTEAGRSMATAREAAPTTGVESRITELTEKSLPLAVGSAAAVAGAGLLHGVPLRDSLSSAVNLAVGSVPEGLPFLVNAAQLAAARRLAELGALVRNPRSIEAMGRVDVLCFDKTGTLTEGRLSVSEVDDGHVRSRVDTLSTSLRPVLAAALRATPHSDTPRDLPHATDRAVAEAGLRHALTPASGAAGWHEVAAVPFEPSRGFHATVGRTRKGLVLSVKGAPEEVLPRCRLDARTRKRLGGRLRVLAQAGHRVLAVAERTLDAGADPGAWTEPDAVDGLTFLGFLAIADPVRGSAAPAAARLREAGVHIVMLTGDHPATGEAIASAINGDHGGLHVVTGAELDELDDAGLRELLPGVDVIARCTPAHKTRIVETYRALGRTVAMTGDGANDAPAIRLADVGIALGGRGTPAARAAADVVVADDTLETIIEALVEGRAMWASVRSALGVLLGGNLGEIAFNVLGAAATGRSPLGARQLLLVNLLTDLAPAMAIALRRPDGATVEDLLREGPESSLGTALHTEIGVRAATTAGAATAAWTLARLTGRRRRAGTIALATLVGTQLGQTLLAGGRSPAVLASGLGSAAVLASVVQVPGVSHFFGCTPLGPVGWGIALGSATTATALGALVG
ncbi:cation-translocating P-type ATPase [Saccharomonospora piscinae]|uniref:cation-translocating P-type ATPase n=1 Tax=Saccharomonospora piscinae TaxID=687388 RepID=UPI00046626B3|nr:cation-translocating P-type ATPase [Saccharomonospora piscinae]